MPGAAFRSPRAVPPPHQTLVPVPFPPRKACPHRSSRPISVTPCGTRRGGENFGSGCFGSGAQSLRASRHFNETRAQSQRGMPGVVGDHQHLIAQRRHQQQIHLREDARHLLRHLAPHSVRLHEIHRRQKPRLTEHIRPRIRNLRPELGLLADSASAPQMPPQLSANRIRFSES